MRKVTLAERFRYAFDNTLSRGPVALIAWLAGLSLTVILVAAAIIALAGFAQENEPPLAFPEAAWQSLMRTFDAGTMGGDTGTGYRLVMLGVTLAGIFVISTLIGVITTGIEGRLEQLRKGRSRVIEADHTVILGWSSQVFAVISELVVANANRRRSCIVVLGEKDKVEMEDEIREHVVSGRTRVVCRTGRPMDAGDLEIASLDTARSIIVLAPEKENPDADVIKTLLAITNRPHRRTGPYHIVAELRDPKNEEVARLIGPGEVELVPVGRLIARIIAQTCRQAGLSTVYNELLDFEGDEIYFQEEPALLGKTFGQALLAYEDSAVIGLCPRGGTLQLNPPMDTLIHQGDRVIAISEDDDTVILSGLSDYGIREEAICSRRPAVRPPERSLVLGWNWRAPAILNELDRYVAPGSEVTVVADHAGGEQELARFCQATHQKVAFLVGDTTDRRTLDGLDIPSYDHVILLCYCDLLDPQEADARTLITLLHLRDIADRCGHSFSITSEMMDVRNRNLAEVTRADDFIVSDRLVSLMLAQVAENKHLNAVFEDLFNPEGSEVYLKPAADYVALGRPVNFYTVVESARRQGQVALGYRLHGLAAEAEKHYGVVVNPDKSDLVTFGERDRIIVLAQD